jgi:hypothetical protein
MTPQVEGQGHDNVLHGNSYCTPLKDVIKYEAMMEFSFY